MVFGCLFVLLFFFAWLGLPFVAVSTAVIYKILVQPQVKLCWLQSLLCSTISQNSLCFILFPCSLYSRGEKKKIRNGVLSQTLAPARKHLPNQTFANKHFFFRFTFFCCVCTAQQKSLTCTFCTKSKGATLTNQSNIDHVISPKCLFHHFTSDHHRFPATAAPFPLGFWTLLSLFNHNHTAKPLEVSYLPFETLSSGPWLSGQLQKRHTTSHEALLSFFLIMFINCIAIASLHWGTTLSNCKTPELSCGFEMSLTPQPVQWCLCIIPPEWCMSSSPCLTGMVSKTKWGSEPSTCSHPRFPSCVLLPFLAVTLAVSGVEWLSTPCLRGRVTALKDLPAIGSVHAWPQLPQSTWASLIVKRPTKDRD